MKGVLVWHQGAIGDLVLSLRSVFSIRKHFGAHPVHLIARSDLLDMAISSHIADEVSSNERALYAEFFAKSDMSKAAADFLKNFEIAFVFMRRKNGIFINNLLRYVPSCSHVCTVPSDTAKEHIAAYQLKQLALMGIGSAALPELDVGGGFAEISEGEPVISLHPGSGGKEKCWPLCGFLELLEALAEEGRYRFFILLGPAEEEMEDECRRFIEVRDISAEIVSNKPFSLVAAILKASSLYVGNDSGISHLAAALGAPTLAIFGPTEPNVWGPLGRRVRIMRLPFPPDRHDFSGLRPGNSKVGDIEKAARNLLSAGSPLNNQSNVEHN